MEIIHIGSQLHAYSSVVINSFLKQKTYLFPYMMKNHAIDIAAIFVVNPSMGRDYGGRTFS
jgi:hypothetical protein